MSVKFDKTNDNNNGDWLEANHATLLAPSVPFTVSIWFYFATAPGETQTIWFHGDKDASHCVVHSTAA